MHVCCVCVQLYKGVTNHWTNNHWTGLDWTGILKFVFTHYGMQLPWNNYLDFLEHPYSICVPGVHSNCSTIYAGDQLCSYTNEKAVVFSNGY